ncbi:MAG TPA: InlB B-repeat-containing protein, partial [Oscillospiraceae bacterium]|nr:InlB B-repeat-containing protein [Oscillospiraceae bacterium]
MPAEDLTINAKWNINNYTITFNSNGGSPVADISLDYGEEIIPPANPTREGYTFQGWDPALPATMPAGDINTTAQWQVNQYKVSFDSKGGSDVDDITEDYGTQIQAPAAPTKTGYTFAGWYADEAYTTAVTWPYTIGASNVTFYAKWNINSYTLTFDANGGTGSMADMSFEYGESKDLTANAFTYVGYDFVGWNTEADGSGTAYTDKAEFGPMGAADVTLYAQWSVYYVTITFNANGGTGGDSYSLQPGTALNAPTVKRIGYVLTGWSPALPAVVPEEDVEYVAQWQKTETGVTLDDGEFVVNISGWREDYQYQIWSYQVVTSDDILDTGEDVKANQWILSQAYTLGSLGTPHGDGSIDFTIAYFTSPTANYLIAVRVVDENGNFVQEIRDAYTPEDVGEPVITKVLVDGKVTTGYELREITGAAVNIKVIGNDVAGMTYSAQVTAGKSSTTIDADQNANNEFNWTLAETLEPGIYIVEVKAEANGNEKTYEIRFELYKTDDQTDYGYIDNLDFAYSNGSVDFDMTYGTESERNDYGNGSFSYRLREPGRKPFYRSVEFTGNDTVTSYALSKPGIYEVDGYVTRIGYIGTEANGAYDDGIIRNFTIPRTGVAPKDIKLNLTANHSLPDIPKGTAVTFTATSEGLPDVQYSFWRYDA